MGFLIVFSVWCFLELVGVYFSYNAKRREHKEYMQMLHDQYKDSQGRFSAFKK